jgi:DNA-binding LacI/PurR family transcriptional regulator
LKAVKSLGRAIPQEIGIVTFDNYPLAQYTEPSLTSIDVDTYLLGEHAAFVLLKTIENETNIQHILVGTKLFQRESTDRKL